MNGSMSYGDWITLSGRPFQAKAAQSFVRILKLGLFNSLYEFTF